MSMSSCRGCVRHDHTAHPSMPYSLVSRKLPGMYWGSFDCYWTLRSVLCAGYLFRIDVPGTVLIVCVLSFRCREMRLVMEHGTCILLIICAYPLSTSESRWQSYSKAPQVQNLYDLHLRPRAYSYGIGLLRCCTTSALAESLLHYPQHVRRQNRVRT